VREMFEKGNLLEKCSLLTFIRLCLEEPDGVKKETVLLSNKSVGTQVHNLYRLSSMYCE
jgi:hypothetical protein